MATSSRFGLALWGIAVLLSACGGGGGGGGSSGVGVEDLNLDGTVTVLCFGDSITRGVGDGASAGAFDDDPPPPAGYPLRLQAFLTPRTDLPLNVIDDGNPGEETADGKTRLRRALEVHRPDYAILLEGTNDLERLRRNVTENMQSMIDSVIAAGSMPLLGTITPTCCHHRNQLPTQRILAYNDALRVMAMTNSIPLIDFYAAFTGLPEGDYDQTLGLIHVPEGLHPTPAGYDLMATTAWEIFVNGPPQP